jgi:hypothetical protein
MSSFGAKVMAVLGGYLFKKSASRAGRNATNGLYKRVTGQEKDLIKEGATKDDISKIHDQIDNIQVDLNILEADVKELSEIHADREFFKMIEQLEKILAMSHTETEIELPDSYINLINKITSQQQVQDEELEKLERAQEYIMVIMNNHERRIEELENDQNLMFSHQSEYVLTLAERDARLNEERLRSNYHETYNLAKDRLNYLKERYHSMNKMNELNNIQSIINPLGLEIVIILPGIDQYYFFKNISSEAIHSLLSQNKQKDVEFMLSDEFINIRASSLFQT